MTVLELRAGALRLVLRPDLGGSMAGLWHDGADGAQPVMRSVAADTLAGPRAGASFPLVPYSNRIGQRRFSWGGHAHELQPNFDGSPHALHGASWRRAWTVLQVDAQQAVLRHVHAPDGDWPFAYEAVQTLHLTPRALQVEMTVSNRADAVAPMGLGWHPYFPRRAHSRLRLACRGRWEPDAQQLPVRREPQPGLDGAVADMAFDHCFDGWDGTAELHDERFALRLSSSLDRVVVFTPVGRDYFCVEPVSHVNNAINADDPAAQGLRALSPGDAMQAWMRLELLPADARAEASA